MGKFTGGILLWLIPFTAHAAGLESRNDSFLAHLLTSSYARLSLLSSRSSQPTDFHNLKTLTNDDGGGEAEKKTPANQNLVSAYALLRPTEGQQFFAAALQSLDPAETRKIATPFGELYLPGRILVSRYKYELSEAFAVSLGAAHIDTLGFTDPFLGLDYLTHRGGGWAHRAALRLTAPLTKSSRRSDLYTKATLRIGTTLHGERFTTYAGLSHSRPFYRDPTSLEKPGAVVNPAKNALPFLRPSDLDLLLSQRESSRSGASIDTSARVSRRLRLQSSGSLALLRTFKNDHLWITRVKPIGLTYTVDQMDIGAELNLVSDIRKYRSPSLPKHWSIGLNVSYSFGTAPLPI